MIACMLVNKTTGRFHPVVFRPAPFPGGAELRGGARYRSHGHHTAGFDTLEEARAWVKGIDGFREVDRSWEWDGVSMPAMTEFFGDEEKGSDQP